MAHVAFFLSLVACATLLALVEIQVEGGEGWAAKLPTWRVDNAFTRLLMSGKPLTGYHTYLISFVLVMAHLPFGLGLSPWSLRSEARVLSFTLFLWFIEDFLWFVINRHWGLRRFRRDQIWWHAPTWWWFMPRDYWTYSVIGSLLYAYSWGAF
jgi:hypothetical protein